MQTTPPTPAVPTDRSRNDGGRLMFERIIVRSWRMLASRGAAAILFGIVAWAWPGLTLAALVLLFGAYALVDGVVSGIAAFRAAQADRSWWPLLAESLLGIAAGAIAVVWIGIGALALVYLIGAWAVLTGVSEIAAAIRMRREIAGEWLLGLSGLLSVLFGVVLFAFPGEGALALVWLIGVYAIFFGALTVGLALRLRRLHDRGGTTRPATQPGGALPAAPAGDPSGHTA